MVEDIILATCLYAPQVQAAKTHVNGVVSNVGLLDLRAPRYETLAVNFPVVSNQKWSLQAEEHQKTTREKFEALSEIGKLELTEFKGRRVTAFRKHLIELGELQLKHSKVGGIQS